MKKMTAISVAALIAFAAVPPDAFAHTGGPAKHAHRAHRPAAGLAIPYAATGASATLFDYGFYPDAPSYPYAPQGGNSGGANFPHSGT